MIEDNTLYQTQIIERLRTGEPLVIHFTKKSTGEARVMTCTLNDTLMPKPLVESAEYTLRPSLSVWDVNAQEWRAFVWKNVTKIVGMEAE